MQGGGGISFGKSIISNMSNKVCQTRGLFCWPCMSYWPTKYYNFNWLSSDLSLTTVHWKYKRNWSAVKLICQCQTIFWLVSRSFASCRHILLAPGTS